jgi:hypothetical protein
MDLRPPHVRVRRHGVPYAARNQLRKSHHQLRVLHAVQVNQQLHRCRLRDNPPRWSLLLFFKIEIIKNRLEDTINLTAGRQVRMRQSQQGDFRSFSRLPRPFLAFESLLLCSLFFPHLKQQPARLCAQPIPLDMDRVEIIELALGQVQKRLHVTTGKLPRLDRSGRPLGPDHSLAAYSSAISANPHTLLLLVQLKGLLSTELHFRAGTNAATQKTLPLGWPVPERKKTAFPGKMKTLPVASRSPRSKQLERFHPESMYDQSHPQPRREQFLPARSPV